MTVYARVSLCASMANDCNAKTEKGALGAFFIVL
jgi:hypothetical protein